MDIRTVGVLGAGQMGGGIAQVAATAEYSVVLVDANRELAEKGRGVIVYLREGSVGVARSASRPRDGLKGVDGLRVGRNVPYSIDFAGDQTIPAHGESGGVPYIEIEICQDLIATCRGQRRIAGLLARAFRSIDAASPAFDEVSS